MDDSDTTDNDDFNYPMVDLDSDQEFGENDSSDDDLDIILHGTPEQRRKLRRVSLGHGSSSEDEFEKEMEAELSLTMKKLKDEAKLEDKGDDASTSAKSAPQFYSNQYFDSDSDEEGTKAEKAERKHPKMTNDDLLYDPDMDREDEMWVQQRRAIAAPSNQPKQTASGRKRKAPKPQPLPHSDAVLNCPACMALLCLDCQRHDTYKSQYRAMFVSNCSVNTTERLVYSNKKTGKKGRKHNIKFMQSEPKLEDLDSIDTTSPPPAPAPNAAPSTAAEDVYHPVKCNECQTEVAVLDQDEVYHFFNVLSSHS